MRPLFSLAVIFLFACSENSTLEIDLDEIDFGIAELGGDPKRVVVDLTNNGTKALKLLRVELTSESSELSMTPPSESEIPPGKTATLRVFYEPIDETADTGTLTIEADDGNGPHVLAVRGESARFELELTLPEGRCDSDPSSISFGGVMADAPARATISLLSKGTGTFNFDVSIESETSEWSLDPASTTTLDPGARGELALRYAPIDASMDRATLVINTNSKVVGAQRITLCGHGVLRAVCSEPANIVFREAQPGSTLTARTRITSCGNLPVAIDTIELARDDGHASAEELSLSGVPALPATLAPSQSIEVDVAFAAKSTAPREGFIHVASDATLTPDFFVPISANQPAPCTLGVYPSSIDFFGSSMTEKRVSIINAGPLACTIDRLAIDVGAMAFSIVHGKRTPRILSRNEMMTLVIAYMPGAPAAWPENASLEITMSNMSNSETIALPITGNPTLSPDCHLDASPAALDFGRTPVATLSEQPVLLTNVGSEACTVTSVAIAGNAGMTFSYLDQPQSTTIDPGAIKSFTVTHYPASAGSARGDLIIRSSDADQPELKIALFAEADPPRRPPPEEVCPVGTQTTYRRYDTPQVGSAVLDPEAEEPFHRACEDHGCMGNDVAVEIERDVFTCDDEPPTCDDGEGLEYRAGGWSCVECEVVVQFGFLFDGLRVCAPKPTLSCNPGAVPTFDDATRRWKCAITCNNGLYDQRLIDGELVCVPC